MGEQHKLYRNHKSECCHYIKSQQ